jgi:hypothetical protein
VFGAREVLQNPYLYNRTVRTVLSSMVKVCSQIFQIQKSSNLQLEGTSSRRSGNESEHVNIECMCM